MGDAASLLSKLDSAISDEGSSSAAAASAPQASSASISLLQKLQDGIDGKPLPVATDKPYETTGKSLGLNTTAGINDVIAAGIGMPVDAATGAVNLGIRGVNAIAGRPVANELGDLPGGKQSIKNAMGLIQANPDNVVPQNEAERIARGAGEGVGGAIMLPLGGEALAAGKVISPAAATAVRSAIGPVDALNTTIGAASGAGSTIAADAVPEPYKPIAATVGGLAAGAPVVAGHAIAQGTKVLYDALPAITEAGKDAKARATVAREMQSAATDVSGARETLSDQPHEIVPGSTGTTAQISDDTGLLGWEGAVRQQNPGAFNARAAEQNAARVEHLESVQPTGNAADLPDAIRAQRDIADQRSKEIVDQLGYEHQAELAKLQEMKPNGSPSDVAAHFRDQRDALDRATQTTVDNAEKNAQKYRDQIPASSAETVGAGLRAPAQEARNAAKEREKQLWNAVDPDGKLAVSMSPVRAAAKDLYGNMSKAAEAGTSPAERSLSSVISQYKPVESFRELTDLRSYVSSAMAQELKTAGRTPAYGRMSQLRGAIESAIDGAVEHHVAQEAHAVARGQLSEEQTAAARLSAQRDAWYEQRKAAAAGMGQSAAANAGADATGGSRGVSSVPGGQGKSRGGLRNDEGNPGVQSDVPLEPNFDEAARDRLNEASEATKSRAKTFDEAATGKILKPGSRAGEYRASDAQVPSIVFHPGPTGGEDVRHYIKAAGGLERAAPALSDAAATSARAAAIRPDGTLDPAKLTSWAQKHAAALAELPAVTRSRFDNAAGAERAISEAMAARRDAIENFNKSSAAKVAGLSDDGDIVRHVGSLLDKKDGARQMGELAAAANGNAAAKEGLKRAVVEDVFSRFLPDEAPKLDKLKSFVDDRRDVLSKVFPEKDLTALTDQIGKAGQAAAKVEKGTELRKAALDQYDKTILGKVMGMDAKRDVIDTVGGIFGKSDAAKQMETLSKAAAKTPGGSDALKKALTEYLQQKFTGTAEAGTTGTLELSRANFLKFMREHTETLGKVLDDAQIGKLSAIVQDQLRANRSITATKLAGGSDTNQKQIAVGKLNAGTIIGHLAMEAGGRAAGAAAGFLAGGGPIGGFLGSEAGSLGAKAMAALRDAGINRLNEIRVRAALDPEFGKALLSEMPKYPDRNAAALIALRARQLSVAGAMAGARQVPYTGPNLGPLQAQQ
jgi:hypothetical protein